MGSICIMDILSKRIYLYVEYNERNVVKENKQHNEEHKPPNKKIINNGSHIQMKLLKKQ